MRTVRGASALATLLVAASAALAAHAAQLQALPSFRVTTPDSVGVDAAALSARDRWLLVYLSPECAPCSTLLSALKRWKSPGLIDRTVLVIGADAASARASLKATLPPELTALHWYADGEGEAWSALALTGAPVLVGVRSGHIAWRASGLLENAATLESVVRTWVEAPEP